MHFVEEIYWKSPCVFNVVFFGSTQTLRHTIVFYSIRISMGNDKRKSKLLLILLCQGFPVFSPDPSLIFRFNTNDLYVPFYCNKFLWKSSRSCQGFPIFSPDPSLPPVFHSKTINLCLPYYNNSYSMDILGELSGISNLLT